MIIFVDLANETCRWFIELEHTDTEPSGNLHKDTRWEDMTIQEVGIDQRVQEQYVPDENVPIAIATDWRSLRRQYGARRVINNNATPI